MADAASASRPEVLVTVGTSRRMRVAIGEALGDAARVAYLGDLAQEQRSGALSSARALLSSSDLSGELDGDGEFALLADVGLVQLLSAGANNVPFARIPPEVAVASNAGAYAKPMAEHVLALTLALAKRLPQNQAALARGEFDQSKPNLELRGSVVGILGYGGIGRASATLFRAFGARIHAIGRSEGDRPEGVDWLGTLEDLDELLGVADVLLIALPLTRSTRGLIGSRELSLMKPTAILVNPARAAILDEGALYEHMRGHPGFSAGIDAWWHEPHDHGSFSTERPLFELPNLLGSPHNSAITRGSVAAAAGQAAANIRRYLDGEPPRHVVDRSEYVDSA